MFSLQFQPLNEAARSTFSQLVCARKMTVSVLESYAAEIQQARDELAGRLRQLIIGLEDGGELVGPVAHDCAFAQVEPAVESNGGYVYVRLPVADAATARAIGQQLLERFWAASLGRGKWSMEASPASRGWGLSNVQGDYFGWRITLPLGRPAIGNVYSPAEIEDALHEAVYGVMLAQGATGSSISTPPYPGNLHLSVDGVQEIRIGAAANLVDLHQVRFSANVAGAASLFVGVELTSGSGLIVPAK